MVEINSFANPYPYKECTIDNFIGMFLSAAGHVDIIGQYGLDSFSMKVLDKRRTATEKIVSLIRFSLASDYEEELAKKIRHFYDLYFLMEDDECHEYLYSEEFVKDLESLLQHDKDLFSQPEGWNRRPLHDSPLLSSIDRIWDSRLSHVYNDELSSLAYKSIPDSKLVVKNIKSIMGRIKSL